MAQPRGSASLERPWAGVVPGVAAAEHIAAFGTAACAVEQGGALVCWGQSAALGYPPRLPTPVAGVDGAVEVCLGEDFGCVRLDDARVSCWGRSSRGLSDPAFDFGPEPTDIGTEGAVQLVCGSDFACARGAHGGAVCWGESDFGQLGDGRPPSTGFALAPVAGIHDAIDLVAGWQHACVAREDGTVWCWGRDLEGQDGLILHRVVLPR